MFRRWMDALRVFPAVTRLTVYRRLTVLARPQKNETRKNHQILIDFSFVSHILYNRINWSEVETCTLKYAWPHIPSSGQTNVQILRNSTFKVDLGWYFWWKNSFIMKIRDVTKNCGSGDPRPSPGRKFRREWLVEPLPRRVIFSAGGRLAEY